MRTRGKPPDANFGAMARIINFNRARKKKLREQAQQQAAQNRVRFGRTLQEKARAAAEADEARRKLDQLKRDEPPDV